MKRYSHQEVRAGPVPLLMYLHDLEVQRLIGDAPVCSLEPLLSLEAFKKEYRGEGAPPLVAGVSAGAAYVPDLTNRNLEIEWEADERGVVVTIDGSPASRIEVGRKYGFSVFTTKDGPWGSPWPDKGSTPGSAAALLSATTLHVSAPSEARRFLFGESPDVSKY